MIVLLRIYSLTECFTVFVGILKNKIRSIWSALEVVDDQPMFSPKNWPVVPLDKLALKVSILCIIM